jgi:hypothetical protein
MHTVENPGKGVTQMFAKIPGRGGAGVFHAFWKISSGYLGFYCIFINNFFKKKFLVFYKKLIGK